MVVAKRRKHWERDHEKVMAATRALGGQLRDSTVWIACSRRPLFRGIP